MAMIKDPTFTTATGKVLKLRPVSFSIMARWQMEWTRRYPAPVPPLQAVVIGLQETSQPNTNDFYYQQQLELWNGQMNIARVGYILSRGVIDNPPKDWQPDAEVIGPNPTEQQLKSIWVEEHILSNEELTNLIEAINSLSGVTSDGLEEAEKN